MLLLLICKSFSKPRNFSEDCLTCRARCCKRHCWRYLWQWLPLPISSYPNGTLHVQNSTTSFSPLTPSVWSFYLTRFDMPPWLYDLGSFGILIRILIWMTFASFLVVVYCIVPYGGVHEHCTCCSWNSMFMKSTRLVTLDLSITHSNNVGNEQTTEALLLGTNYWLGNLGGNPSSSALCKCFQSATSITNMQPVAWPLVLQSILIDVLVLGPHDTPFCNPHFLLGTRPWWRAHRNWRYTLVW